MTQPSDQLPIQGLAGANPYPPTRQPSHMQQGLAGGVAPRRGAPRPPTLDAPPTEGLAPLDNIVDELTTLRARINLGMLYLQCSIDNPKRNASGEHRLVRLVTDEYLPMIELARHEPADELRSRRDAVEERLNRGWSTTGKRSDELFVKLLTEYEALTDVLSGDVLPTLLDRIAPVRA